MFTIDISEDALDELCRFRKRDSTMIFDEIERQLAHQPNVETRNRKPLRPNPFAEWELRVDKFRVFYDVDTEGNTVLVKAIALKVVNKLLIRGKEFLL